MPPIKKATKKATKKDTPKGTSTPKTLENITNVAVNIEDYKGTQEMFGNRKLIGFDPNGEVRAGSARLPNDVFEALDKQTVQVTALLDYAIGRTILNGSKKATEENAYEFLSIAFEFEGETYDPVYDEDNNPNVNGLPISKEFLLDELQPLEAQGTYAVVLEFEVKVVPNGEYAANIKAKNLRVV